MTDQVLVNVLVMRTNLCLGKMKKVLSPMVKIRTEKASAIDRMLL